MPAALTSATGGDIDETEGPELFDEGRLPALCGLCKEQVSSSTGYWCGLSYASQVLLARLLGASNYGVYTYVFVWVTFVSLLAGLGFPAASVRFLPVYRVKQDWARISGFTRSTSKFTFATAIAITLVAVVSALLLHIRSACASVGHLVGRPTRPCASRLHSLYRIRKSRKSRQHRLYSGPDRATGADWHR